MQAIVRPFEERDQDAVVALSLRAWAPVFASLEGLLGESGVYSLMHPDWRVDQRQAVRDACESEGMRVWIAESGSAVIGFVAARLDHQARMGEIYMIAVDPAHQRTGVGSLLTSHALQWFRDSGMTVAMVETGGDPGHAPARRTYERTGFTLLPIARYFKNLAEPGADGEAGR
jgi:GNAT superfamily N-acetyltransferase